MNEQQAMEALERGYPELVDRVHNHRMSLRAACTIAGIDYRPPRTVDQNVRYGRTQPTSQQRSESEALIELARVLYDVMDDSTRQRLRLIVNQM